MLEKGESNEGTNTSEGNNTPCVETYMVHIQPKEDRRKPFKEYFKHGQLLSPKATKEEQAHIRRASEPYIMEDDKLLRISPSGESKTCIAG